METQNIEKKEIDQVMELDGSMMSILNETRKWTKFLSILGFIGIGVMLIGGIFAGSYLGSMTSNIPGGTPVPGALYSVIYIVMAIVYFFPVLFLFNFSNKMKIALYSNNQAYLYDAFNNLKRHFKFIGILLVIVILVWGTIIIGMGIFGAMAA